MAAKFEITEADDGSFTFDLKSANGEVIATGQSYTSHADALAGVIAVRDTAPVAELPPEDHLLHMQ